MHPLISLMAFERKHFDLYPETIFTLCCCANSISYVISLSSDTLDGKLFFSNAGIKDRAEEYAKLFVDNR